MLKSGDEGDRVREALEVLADVGAFINSHASSHAVDISSHIRSDEDLPLNVDRELNTARPAHTAIYSVASVNKTRRSEA